ncbi:glycosyltransferase family 2 protein [Oculatella sp. LEGE 06141]|uniref:glycosyltransferase family 2 protein n=1 Tax=Oculatella sp. LEGE 06141 TaxID=1828648 RepID=UPI0018828529|nr:glycosyltransferase family 2 protein [Oculatella sp. LEGE 06141]MBE9182614.1 glycosyltransferase family 2 protein [Oculatella sp. LEGE 06141]
MTSLPLVSIIIPCYNGADRLLSCLGSCAQQQYPHLEILVVDNGSTDHSRAIAEQFANVSPHPVRLLHCSQQGANHARNHGFSHAQGEYIQWLDADDELTPGKIEVQVQALEKQKADDIAYGDWEWCFYQQGQRQSKLAFSSQPMVDPLLRFLLHHWRPPHSYLLRYKAAERLQTVHAWHPDTPIGTDREYFTMAAVLGLQFLYVPGATVCYNHWSGTQMSRSASYWQRVYSLRQMYERFQQQLVNRSTDHLSAAHWFLLKQNWNVWKLAPAQLTQLGAGCFWLQHQTVPVGMTLTPAEARIALALSQLGGTYTLEDQSYRILRVLWKHIAGRTDVDAARVGIELSKAVGLLPMGEGAIENLQRLQQESTQQSQTSIDTIPISAPLFPEQRLAVLRLLDQLRVVGLLTSGVQREAISPLAVESE